MTRSEKLLVLAPYFVIGWLLAGRFTADPPSPEPDIVEAPLPEPSLGPVPYVAPVVAPLVCPEYKVLSDAEAWARMRR